MFNNKYAIVFLILALYLGYYQYRYESFPEIITLFINKEYNGTLFKHEELNEFNGIIRKSLYLSILGNVFDVTNGREHYAPGASYNAFVGKDASRLFVTGEFSSEGDNIDDVNDLPCSDLFSLQGWVEMYNKRYLYRGRLVGRYYDDQGKETQYYINTLNKIEKCKEEQLYENDMKKMMPPCNVEWTPEVGTRVWCSSKSGGVQRSWVGVPRQLFTPGKQDPTCVCINTDTNTNAATLKEYSNCDHKSVSCYVEGSKQ